MLAPILLGVLSPSQAQAHAELRSSNPGPGSHLGIAPRELRLNFSESIELAFTTIMLRGPSGGTVALGAIHGASDSRRAVVAAVGGALVAGTYTVEWKVAGADGHPVQGRFDFTIAPGATGLNVEGASADSGDPGSRTAHNDATSLPMSKGFDAESPLYVAVRWLLYLGLLAVIGAFAFQRVVLPVLGRTARAGSGLRAALGNRAASLGVAGGAVVALAGLLRLYAQSFAMHGATRALDRTLVSTMLATTNWGQGWLLQLAGVIVVLTGFTLARRGHARGWTLAGIGALALAFSAALSGHAAAAPQLTALVILADGLHIIGAGGWLGSLVVVLTVGIPAALRLDEHARHDAVADLINAFSPAALAFSGLTAATGVFAAWIHLGDVTALWRTTYGQTLLVKLAVLSVVAGIGAYNWLRVKPTLGTAIGSARIRKSARFEIAAGIVVILVTAVLVATPISMDSGVPDSTSGPVAVSTAH